jgi:hypothetical protein
MNKTDSDNKTIKKYKLYLIDGSGPAHLPRTSDEEARLTREFEIPREMSISTIHEELEGMPMNVYIPVGASVCDNIERDFSRILDATIVNEKQKQALSALLNRAVRDNIYN